MKDWTLRLVYDITVSVLSFTAVLFLLIVAGAIVLNG